MPNIRNYRDLLVWQKAMDLCATVYRLIEPLPKQEDYALQAQIRRAVVSIPSNIAEGHDAITSATTCTIFPSRKAPWPNWRRSSS